MHVFVTTQPQWLLHQSPSSWVITDKLQRVCSCGCARSLSVSLKATDFTVRWGGRQDAQPGCNDWSSMPPHPVITQMYVPRLARYTFTLSAAAKRPVVPVSSSQFTMALLLLLRVQPFGTVFLTILTILRCHLNPSFVTLKLIDE